MSSTLKALRLAESRRITHRVFQARDIIEHWSNLQQKSGFPYILYGDAVNTKSMQANIGPVNASNLCMEILEATTPSNIASCNLASLSLKAFARKRLSKELIDRVERNADVDVATLEGVVRLITASGAFDFQALSDSMRSVQRNLDSILEHNYYPVPHMTKELNQTSRPLGIGVSGFYDALAILDVCYESRVAEALNVAIFSCMHYSGIVESCELAKEYGEYSLFRTGTCTFERAAAEPAPQGTAAPISSVASSSTPGVVLDTYAGSPSANGLFQFDLWNRRAGVLAALGHLNTNVYNRADDVPISPSAWGATFGVGGASPQPPSWEALREQVQKYGMRNSLLLAVMPTATSAQAMRNAEATEAHSANVYVRTVLSGRFTVLNQHMIADLEEIGAWNAHTIEFLFAFSGSLTHFKRYLADHSSNYPDGLSERHAERIDYLVRKYKTMYEISQKCVLKYTRQRGIYVDQSQSTNLFVTDAKLRTIVAMHTYGHALGVKTGIYYLRQEPADTSDFTQSAKMIEYSQSVLKKPAAAAAPAPSGGGGGGACPIDPVARAQCLSCE